jgi:Xaa-Pro dipeptidase
MILFLIGVAEPDFHLVIDIATKRIQLISPNVNPEHVMWMGLPDSLETLASKYDVDEAVYVDKLNDILSTASIVYTLPITKNGAVDTSKVKLCNAQQSKKLHTAFAESRAIKAQWEVDIIREANRISSYAHNKVSDISSADQVAP